MLMEGVEVIPLGATSSRNASDCYPMATWIDQESLLIVWFIGDAISDARISRVGEGPACAILLEESLDDLHGEVPMRPCIPSRERCRFLLEQGRFFQIESRSDAM